MVSDREEHYHQDSTRQHEWTEGRRTQYIPMSITKKGVVCESQKVGVTDNAMGVFTDKYHTQ